IELGRLTIAVFGPLPEFALVVTRIHGPILLALMLEDRAPLAEQLLGAERHGHLDSLRLPFLPRPAIEPDLARGEPLLLRDLLASPRDRRQAHSHRAVRIEKHDSHEDFVR